MSDRIPAAAAIRSELLGSALASRGELRESRAEFSRALELDPHHTEALEALDRRGDR